MTKVEATGDLEVTLTLDRPLTLVPANLAVFAAGIVSPTALETYKDDYSNHAAGTGPFKLDHWTKDVELVFVANEDYWGGRPKLDRIVWRTIADDTVKLSELTTGGSRRRQPARFQGRRYGRRRQQPAVDHRTVLECAVPRSQPELSRRSTISRSARRCKYAINKQNIADVVFYGNYTLGAGPIAPGLLGYDARWPRSTPTIRNRPSR